ncbi:MAG: AMP-binding protein [Rhodospirillales bacterium]|nr:AMP-binding protein [Rhodospirillales bacterium]
MTIRPAAGRLDSARIEQCYQAGYWRDEVVGDLLAKHATERPDAVAIIDGDHRISWARLHQLSQRFALHLREFGVEPGDAVALQMPNWFEYLICYHGIRFAGAVVVQIGADWRSAEMAYGFGVGPAKVAIVPKEFLGYDYPTALRELRPDLPDLKHVLVARGDAPDGAISLDEILADPIEDRIPLDTLRALRPSPDQIIRIVFTSGTTGLPKAIMHTDNTLAHSGRTVVADFHHDAGDVVLMFIPFSTNFGAIMGLQLPLAAGAAMVLMERFSATGALDLIGREKVTYIAGTPTGFMALSNSPAAATARVESLRLLLSAGDSFPVQAIKDLRERFPATFIDSFGMNEFGMGLWCLPGDDPDQVDGSIGRAIAGVEARIVNSDGQDAPAGEIGEMVIKSAGMCAGYFNQPEANASAWDKDGWFHSGDLATMDDKGYFRVVGRSKDVIIRGGGNVSPREIEELLIRDPRIREVSVIGLPDEHYGEIVCACIIPTPGETPTQDQIHAYLKPLIASSKLPSRIEIVTEFPLNSMGKVRKDVLRDRVLRSSSP